MELARTSMIGVCIKNPRFKPTSVKLIDPVAALFILNIELSPGISAVNMLVELATSRPAVKSTLRDRRKALPQTMQETVVDDSHFVEGHFVC